MFEMGSEFDRNETNEQKKEYAKSDAWAQELFNAFYKVNQHSINEITAMREVLYEKTGVRVVKDPQTEEEFDWSHYDKKEENKKKVKPYQVLHCINHTQKDYMTKESAKVDTALKHYQNFYMNGHNGHLKLATALVENHAIEEEKELLTMTFVQNSDYKKGEEGFGYIYEDFVSFYLDMLIGRNQNLIYVPSSFHNSFAVKPEQCKQYKEAMMSFVEKVTEWKHGETTEKVMSFEKSKMKEFEYYYEVKKKNSFKCYTDIMDFVKLHKQIEINGVVFEFKLTSKNTAMINLYFGEKGASFIGKL